MEILFGLKIVLLMHKKWSRRTRWALRSVISSLKYSYLSENTKKKDKSCHKHFDSCCFFFAFFFCFVLFLFFLVLVFFVLFLFCFVFFWCDPEFWDRNGYCK